MYDEKRGKKLVQPSQSINPTISSPPYLYLPVCPSATKLYETREHRSSIPIYITTVFFVGHDDQGIFEVRLTGCLLTPPYLVEALSADAAGQMSVQLEMRQYNRRQYNIHQKREEKRWVQ